MNAVRSQQQAGGKLQGLEAFSLIEIMVTVALLSFIIIGLVAMFNQTRRAFTSSMTQVDVLESGRSAADVMTREFEQITPSGVAFCTNFDVESPININQYNFLAQTAVDPNEQITNNLQTVFFITYGADQQWRGIGYRFANTNQYQNGIVTLYRYSTDTDKRFGPIATGNVGVLTNLGAAFLTNTTDNMTRLIDGVVDFRVRVFDTNGNMFQNFNNTANTIFVSTNYLNIIPPAGDQSVSHFSAGAVPAYVEIEIGVLEDRALARYQSLTNSGSGPGTPAWNYLANHLGQVHVFRQRIAIRNVNPAAY